MAKPICVVKVVDSATAFVPIFELQKILDDKLTDYHVLVVPFTYLSEDTCYEPMRVQVFHEKDFTDIQYHELKQLIEDNIKQTINERQTIS